MKRMSPKKIRRIKQARRKALADDGIIIYKMIRLPSKPRYIR